MFGVVYFCMMLEVQAFFLPTICGVKLYPFLPNIFGFFNKEAFNEFVARNRLFGPKIQGFLANNQVDCTMFDLEKGKEPDVVRP